MPFPFDEYWQSKGQPRPHQEPLARFAAGLPPEQRELLQRTVGQRTVEQEITFNILGDPGGTSRQWQLDWLPLVLDPVEFEALTLGLRQRARLLDAILRDLYGARRLLTERLLPGGLVYGSPRFFRAVHGWVPDGQHRLYVYAADLGRTASGNFVVYSDRTAAPTGSGYALENRLVVGRLLAELFQSYPVEKINRFFETLGNEVRGAAPRGVRDPRVVVLTPGVHDESSFEHGYLARYLGFPLAEGRDLTVRNDQVFMKTLTGLERVDVVLRRVFDDWCDPLVLRGDSSIGVPGLLAAARAGQVALINPLGAALVESPAMKAYLPRLAQRLLGEELLLPSVETRWCGEPAMLREVEADLDAWVLKSAFLERREPPLPFGQLPPGQREDLRERLRQRPGHFVAERWPALSVAPVSAPDGSAGTIALRCFLCRSEDDFYAMPGGLARVDAEPDGVFITVGGDALSKDVWVLGDQSARPPRLPAMPEGTTVLRRGGVNLPSRLLDDIFWLGRTLERCDQGARLVRAGLERSTSDVGANEVVLPGIDATLQALEFAHPQPVTRVTPETYLACFDRRGGANNVRGLLDQLHRLTVAVRSRLSRDTWHVLQELHHVLPPTGQPGPTTPEAGLDLAQDLIVAVAAVQGLVADGMVRGFSWDFLDIGRRLERGVFMAHLLRGFLSQGTTRDHLEALLEVADSLLTYRSRYLASLQPAPVVDLLLLDATNPHSVLFQVNRLLRSARRLPRHTETVTTPLERKLVAMHAELIMTDVHEVCSGDGEQLRLLLESSAKAFWSLSDEITRSHFSHAGGARSVAATPWINDDLEAT